MRATPVTLLPLTLWLLSSAAMAATVYKWVDAQGVTHYSDQPHAEAKVIDVQPMTKSLSDRRVLRHSMVGSLNTRVLRSAP